MSARTSFGKSPGSTRTCNLFSSSCAVGPSSSIGGIGTYHEGRVLSPSWSVPFLADFLDIGLSRLNDIRFVYPRGKPRPRVAMMFRWISDVPPSIVLAMLRTKAYECRPRRGAFLPCS